LCYTFDEVADMSGKYKIALCQTTVTADKEQNLKHAAECVSEAARRGARVVCLPEMWNSPYDLKLLGDYAEPADGPSATLMSELAREQGIYLIGGSIPEDGGQSKIYNTAFVFDPKGEMIAKHRKVNLFDVDIEKGVRFKESDFFAKGEDLTVFDTDLGRMGVAICFDVRFPEMFRDMNKAGAHIIFLPAAFNINTGSAHWDILMKSRALDNQLYIAACGPARDLKASFITWSHSCVATPWGEYCAAADARETIVYADIDIDYMNKIRQELPIGN